MKDLYTLYNKLLVAKCTDPQVDTSKLKAEVDQLVYQLYGLTEEEIKIVEGK
jgi:adenine-specific DNA-methyltransferase